MSANNYLYGIDLGGTKIEGVVLEKDNPKQVVFRERIATEAEKGYEHVLQRIGQMIGLMEEKSGQQAENIGIGTPGAIDPHTGLLTNSNSVVLNHQPFLKDLKSLIGKEVQLANDANCFALAETRLGVVQEVNQHARVVFGVIIGTGVGGGIVVNGKVIDGHQGIAGEWGHNYLDKSGGKCYCGKTGCVETILSGPALERYYQSLGGHKKKLKDIIETQATDENAQKTLERLHHFFGKGLASVINILDPEIIIIGGGVGNVKSLYDQGLKEVRKYVFNTRFDTVIVPPKLGDSAGVFGAALLTA
ncbi:MAG: ROK family protein [Fulvivirga sp.]|nr:ROK family protein [Fulvivirga sp.]